MTRIHVHIKFAQFELLDSNFIWVGTKSSNFESGRVCSPSCWLLPPSLLTSLLSRPVWSQSPEPFLSGRYFPARFEEVHLYLASLLFLDIPCKYNTNGWLRCLICLMFVINVMHAICMMKSPPFCSIKFHVLGIACVHVDVACVLNCLPLQVISAFASV